MRGEAHEVHLRVGNFPFYVGEVEYYNSRWDDPSVRAAVIASVVVFVVIVAIVIAYFLIRKFYEDPIQYIRNRLSTKSASKQEPNPYEMRPRLLMDILQHSNPELFEDVKSCLIEPHTRMRVGQEIGKGNFGKVYAGLFVVTGEERPRDCAIKTLKG